MADAKSLQEKIAADKISKLTKYLEQIKSRMASAVPEKHKQRPEAFKDWLALEFKRTTRKIEGLRG